MLLVLALQLATSESADAYTAVSPGAPAIHAGGHLIGGIGMQDEAVAAVGATAITETMR